MKIKREVIGYTAGFILFIILIPFLMWRSAAEVHAGSLAVFLFVLLTIAGIGLSIWSILYMRLVGRGNPMDAFNHEVAPHTRTLMTEGPYRLCRNPMLLGVFVYYLGLLILLGSLKAAIIFIVFIGIMMIQVNCEEKRLEQDFGEAYRAYKKKTKKIIPYIW